MKRITCTLMLIFSFILLRAQVPNPGFEKFDTLGGAKHWTRMYMFPAWLDSNGVFHKDTILAGPRFYQVSSDAHSGAAAMELLNGYNISRKEGIAGAVDLTGLPDAYGGFNSRVAVTSAPKELRFWYKFLPVGGDTAQALLITYDSTGAESGFAEILLTNRASTYTMASVPIGYLKPETGAASFSLSFSASKTSSSAHFGTRLLIDDVNLSSLGIHQEQVRTLNSYPTVVNDQVHVELPALTQCTGWQLLNASGQILRSGTLKSASRLSLTVPELPAGNYVIALQANDGRYMTRFIKQ
jgi:hypothetical protein